MITAKPVLLVAVLLLIGGSIWYLNSMKVSPVGTSGWADIPLVGVSTTSSCAVDGNCTSTKIAASSTIAVIPERSAELSQKAKLYPRAKELVNPVDFINAEPFKLADVVGKKVILVDFWTYSCINCQRTTPYLNAWYEKYKDKGLVIVGVHTPEFEFEKNYNNVLMATKNENIKYPVVLDNNYETWSAYGNRFWPRKYLIDIDGYIIYDHIGEGAYEETEKKIQAALEERMVALGLNDGIASGISKPSDAIDVDSSKPLSPEIYFGAGRNSNFGNGLRGAIGVQRLIEPSEIKTNILYFTGDWDIQNQFAENKTAGAKIIYRYQAKNVYLVASSVSGVKIKVLKDGKVLGPDAGEDILKDGPSSVFVKEDRLYKIISDTMHGEHTLELIIETPGLKAFTFTFG